MPKLILAHDATEGIQFPDRSNDFIGNEEGLYVIAVRVHEQGTWPSGAVVTLKWKDPDSDVFEETNITFEAAGSKRIVIPTGEVFRLDTSIMGIKAHISRVVSRTLGALKR